MNTRPSAQLNDEMIAERYDPAFVRRVDFLGDHAAIRVCVDARMLNPFAGTGVATYARVLAQTVSGSGAVATVLDEQAPHVDRSRARIGRWVSALDVSPRVADERAFAAPPGWTAPDIFREAQVFFNIHARPMPVRCEHPPEVMHWTYPVPLYMQVSRNLYTVHDLIPLTDPTLTRIDGTRHRRLIGAIGAVATGFVTVSETMRTVIRATLGEAAPAVFNAYQAVDVPMQRDPQLPPTLRRGRYFLVCGTVETRKNIARVVAAHRISGVTQPLVIVGPGAPGNADLEALIAGAPNVVRLPWQPRADLVGLIRSARGLIFASQAEGFGLPIAEAMMLGCPVLTSNRGAPAEVAGSAALLVDPTSIVAIAEAIARLGKDDHLCARLRTAGFDRARVFAPAAYGRRLRALYAEVLARPMRGSEGA